jgi:hypothetical protein
MRGLNACFEMFASSAVFEVGEDAVSLLSYRRHVDVEKHFQKKRGFI